MKDRRVQSEEESARDVSARPSGRVRGRERFPSAIERYLLQAPLEDLEPGAQRYRRVREAVVDLPVGLPRAVRKSLPQRYGDQSRGYLGPEASRV